MLCSAPDEPAIVGYARTAKIAAVNAPTEAPNIVKARRMAYYKHMADAPMPAIAVVEDTDYPDCIGAYWGEINTTVHKGFGLSGTLTNGVMRDLGDVPSGYPVVAGSIGPSHGFVHVQEIGTQVEIFGMTVSEGDLIHADRHGAVIIPSDVIENLENAVKKLLSTEHLILEPARRSDFNYEMFEKAWTEFEKSRT
jgi:regulator of RNase E activity RraA